MAAGVDIHKPGLSRSFQSVIAALVASLGASLVLTGLLWLWDTLSPVPSVDYDPAPPSYALCWLALLIPATLYGLVIGQLLHQAGRRLKTRKLPFYLVANLLCAGAIGMAFNLWAGQSLADSNGGPTLDYLISFGMFGAVGASWGLIFFIVRRPDRDRPGDMSVSAS